MRANSIQNVPEEDNRINLLLVDDEAPFRANVARLLDKRGFATHEAENGATCFEALEKWPLDVVVLDVKMPGMNGIEILRRIRKQYPEIEVILLTGNASASDGVEGIKSGAFDYLHKPIEIEHLAGKIRQAHDQIRLREIHRQEVRFRASVEQKMAETERLASLGTLATGVAHEINNPLAVIKQSIGLMRLKLKRQAQSGLQELAEFEKILKNVEEGTERIRRITHQLLMYVGRDNTAAAQVDLKELVADVLSTLQGTISKKGIALVEKIGPDVQHVCIDPYKLRQVLVNLLLNALQATDTGGTITINAATVEKDFTLTIEDTGAGISEENKGKIFDPFFTTKSPGEGTGLGLFVTRSIVTALGGTITLASRPGPGCTFLVRFPNAKDPVDPVVKKPGMIPGK